VDRNRIFKLNISNSHSEQSPSSTRIFI